MWFKVQVTNHRVYQNLVYRNELFVKKSLTGVPSLSPLPYPFVAVVVVVDFSAYIFLRLQFPTIWTPVTGCGKLDHHISAVRKRDGYKQLYVSVEFTK